MKAVETLRKLRIPLGLFAVSGGALILSRDSSKAESKFPPIDPPKKQIITFAGERITLPQHLSHNPNHVLAHNSLYQQKYDLDGLSLPQSRSGTGKIMSLELLPDLKDENYQLAVLMAHGGVDEEDEDRKLKINLFKPYQDEENDLVQELLLLQKKTGIKNFYVLSCYSGAVINYLKLLTPHELKTIGFLPDTKIVAFGSHKHEILSGLLFAIVSRVVSEQESTQDFGFLAAKLSMEFGITVKCLTIDDDSKGVDAREVKYNLHKYPEIWERLQNKDAPADLTESEKLELIVLEEQQKNLFLTSEQKSRLEILNKTKELLKLYSPYLAEIPESFPSLAFIESVGRGNIKRAAEWLKTGKVEIDHLGYGMPAFPIAACSRNIKMMEFLLKNGADVNVIDVVGNTTLMWAVESNESVLVKYLLSRGADPNVKNKEGKSLFDLGIDSASPMAEYLMTIRHLQESFDKIPELKGKIIVKCHAENHRDPLKIRLASHDSKDHPLPILEEAIKRIDQSSPIGLVLAKIISDVKEVKSDEKEIKTDLNFGEAIRMMGMPSVTLAAKFAQVVSEHQHTVM